MKVSNTKVLSARVQPDVYTAWQNLAKAKNMSVSECLRDTVTMVDGTAILKNQDKIDVPNDLTEVSLSIAGGGLAAILIYKGLRITLEENTQSHGLNQNEIEAISLILALSGAVLLGSGIYKALKP
jgi:hypothetical protein